MAANNKFDASLSSPDGPTYSNGQQRSHSVAPLKKLRKFRKGSDCSLASSSGISKANATSSQGNMTCLVQSLASDLKVVVADHRLNRLGKMKTTITSIFGASANDTPSVKLGTKPLSSSFGLRSSHYPQPLATRNEHPPWNISNQNSISIVIFICNSAVSNVFQQKITFFPGLTSLKATSAAVYAAEITSAGLPLIGPSCIT